MTKITTTVGIVYTNESYSNIEKMLEAKKEFIYIRESIPDSGIVCCEKYILLSVKHIVKIEE